MGGSGSKEVAPPDTVLLHGNWPRCYNIVHPSCFVVKVELFLRINKIPYKFTDKGGFSPKGRVPWIEYNGDIVSDSQFIIKYLNKKFDIDMDKNLSEMEKANATAYRIMTEEFLYFIANMEFSVYNDAAFIKSMVNYPTPMIWVFKNRESGKMKIQGINNHTMEEVRAMADEQLGVLSAILGEKPYMMGEEPTQLDCSVFGVLSTFKWAVKEDNPVRKMIEEKYKNLDEYIDRIKTTYYPDWDELVAQAVADRNKNTKATATTENTEKSNENAEESKTATDIAETPEKPVGNDETSAKPAENEDTSKKPTENGEAANNAKTEVEAT